MARTHGQDCLITEQSAQISKKGALYEYSIFFIWNVRRYFERGHIGYPMRDKHE